MEITEAEKDLLYKLFANMTLDELVSMLERAYPKGNDEATKDRVQMITNLMVKMNSDIYKRKKKTIATE